MSKFSFAGAKEKVESQLREQLSGSYSPILIRKDEYICIIWREPLHGWTYRVLHIDGIVRDKLHLTVSANWDREECERFARKHLAQYLYNGDRTGEDVILNENDRRQHLDWVAWQRRYKEAREQGKSDEEARAYASAR